jgi:hypothetical protein
MRFIVFIILVLAALWAGDKYLYKSRYFNHLWSSLNEEAQKINHDVRRWVTF